MTDEVEVAEEATEEVVQTEAEEVEAPEAAESTEGQPDEAPAEGDEKPEEEKLSRHQRRKARFDELKAQKRELEEKLEQTRERESRLEEAAKGNQPPKEADFEDYNEYMIARGAWHAAQEFDRRGKGEIQREAEQTERQIEVLQREQQEEAQKNWADQREDAMKRYSDFDAVVTAPDVPITQQMAQLLMQSEAGADVAYQLGMNKDLARQIAGMSPIEQAMEIGRLSATVQVPKPKTTSQAPQPINPNKGQASVKGGYSPNMTPDEFRAWRAAGGKF